MSRPLRLLPSDSSPAAAPHPAAPLSTAAAPAAEDETEPPSAAAERRVSEMESRFRLSSSELLALDRASPEVLLDWAAEFFGPDLVLATSFQAEGSVLLDMASRRGLRPRVLTLDTGRLPQETFDMMEIVRDRYGLEIEVIAPRARDVEALVRDRGPNLFHLSVDDRVACCRVRKVEPLRRALRGAAAWIAGLRRDQTPSRAGTPKVAFDEEHAAWKLAPLADWDWARVDAYLRRHRVPRHPLYSKGYLSIGCAPCTRAVREGEAPRAGRWWWEQGTQECGLHLPSPAGSAGSLTAGRLSAEHP